MKLKSFQKITFLIILLFSINSCRKDNNEFAIDNVGDLNEYSVTTHDVTLDPDITAGTGMLKHSIDLDLDGIGDVEFTSLEFNSGYNTGRVIEVSFEVFNLESINRKISFYEHEKSGVQYEKYTHTYSVADNGHTPIRTTVRKMTCDKIEGSRLNKNANGAVNCVRKGGFVKEISLNKQRKKIDLIRNDLSWKNGPSPIPGEPDSLITFILDSQGLCEGRAPYNQDFYLAFMITNEVGLNPRYGWIQLYLTGQNTLTIVASGIKEK
ncbi:hypothetical protein [Crocinitomix catalasitica]|uniref:hypothetical protein n=1 Tax=Crocinitomix catalasitica TaxID=184607 RepID=UPI000481AD76|nr:hypothetical protein [Crocinitomix catalasitica]